MRQGRQRKSRASRRDEAQEAGDGTQEPDTTSRRNAQERKGPMRGETRYKTQMRENAKALYHDESRLDEAHRLITSKHEEGKGNHPRLVAMQAAGTQGPDTCSKHTREVLNSNKPHQSETRCKCGNARAQHYMARQEATTRYIEHGPESYSRLQVAPKRRGKRS